MLPPELYKEIIDITPVERQQILGHGRNVPDVKTKLPTDDSSIILMPFWHFFDHCKIAVTKSNRFSYVPAHTHKFIEMNFVLHGNSSQYIDDHKYLLRQGQLLIMDRSVMQRINYASKDDILINILIRDDAAIRQLIDGLAIQQIEIGRFLFNATQKHFNHDNYQIFDFNNNPTALRLIESIIINGWHNDGSHNQMLYLLLKALFLASQGSLIEQQTNFIDARTDTLIPVINYLNTHFRDITLRSLAKHFGYTVSPNTLATILITWEIKLSVKWAIALRSCYNCDVSTSPVTWLNKAIWVSPKLVNTLVMIITLPSFACLSRSSTLLPPNTVNELLIPTNSMLKSATLRNYQNLSKH